MNIMLVLSTTCQIDKTKDAALKIAKEKNGKLITVFVLDSKIPNTVFEELTDMGFIGEKPGVELTETVMREYRKQAYEKLDEIEADAKAKGIDFKGVVSTGAFVEEAVKAAEDLKADVLVVPKCKEAKLWKLVFGSSVDELKKRLHCEVVLVEE